MFVVKVVQETEGKEEKEVEERNEGEDKVN